MLPATTKVTAMSSIVTSPIPTRSAFGRFIMASLISPPISIIWRPPPASMKLMAVARKNPCAPFGKIGVRLERSTWVVPKPTRVTSVINRIATSISSILPAIFRPNQTSPKAKVSISTDKMFAGMAGNNKFRNCPPE